MLEALSKVSTAFSEPQKAAEKFAVATANIGKTAASAGKAAEKSAGGMSKFASSIARIAKYRLIRAVIRGIVDAVKEGAENFYNFSKASNDSLIGYSTAVDKVKSAAQVMKNQVGSAFGSLYAAIAPIILKLIEIATKLANVFTMLFAKLGGADGWYRAKEGADAAADSAAGAGKAAKEAMKYLAPFDELNRLSSKNNDNGGGGTSTSSSGGGGYEWVPFDKFDIADGIKEIFDWIKDAFNNISDWIASVDWVHLASDIVNWIIDAFSKVDWAGVTQSIARFLGSAIGAVTAFVVGACIDLAEWLTNKFKEIFDDLADLFLNDDGTMKSGRAIIEGIWKGILDALTGVYNWIKTNIFDPFMKGFMAAFGIASPAKEMEGPGEMIGQGILVGIAAPFKAIGAWIKENILDPIKNAFDKSEDIGVTLSAAVKLVKDGWTKVSDWVKEYLGGAVNKAIGIARDGWTSVGAWIKDSYLGGAITKAIGLARNGWTSVKKWITDSFLGGAVSALVGLVRSGWKKVSDWITGRFMGADVQKNVDLKRDGWKSVANWITSNNFLGALSIGISLVRQGWTTVIEWLKQFLGAGATANGVAGNQFKTTVAKNGIANNSALLKAAETSFAFSYGGFSAGASSYTTNIVNDSEETFYRAMLRALTDADFGENVTEVNLDGNVLYRAMVRRNRMNTAATGVNAMA